MADVVTTRYQPGYRLIDGSDLNDSFDQVNAALDGSTSAVYKGTFNGVIGGTTPAAANFTYSRQSAAAALTAAGTNRGNALQLAAAINVLGTVASGTGAALPLASGVGVGGSTIVFNDGANPAKIYALGSETIDGVAGSTGVTLTNALRCQFYVTAALTWKSAKLGATST